MSRKLQALLVTGAVLLVAIQIAPGAARPGTKGPVRLSTELTGEAEEPDPGDPDGTGTVRLKLKRNAGKVCYRLSWANIADPTAAHIHQAPAGAAGGVVVTLFNETVTRSKINRCVKNVDRNLIDDIIENPEDYYVNVHNAEFPSGAIRGQLDGN